MTKEQLERARQLRVLDYVLAYEADNFRRVGNGYRHKEHPSLAVSENGFYWHSREIGGRTALDYLTDVHGYGLVDAACMLLGESPFERGVIPQARSPTQSVKPKTASQTERLPLSLPLRNKDNRRVIAYLQSRGIDRDLILDCINQGSLYESASWHNCVFTGKDERGKTRFAAMRGTTSNFKRDADGSDKKYGFVIPPENSNSREIAAFEAPIDCLSHQTLCKQGFIEPFGGWRLSLGGTGIIALEHFLATHPEVTHCRICTDNDEAGAVAAAKISEIPGISSERSLPASGNDWNDMLMSAQKAERMQNKSRDKNIQNL